MGYEQEHPLPSDLGQLALSDSLDLELHTLN